MNVSSATSGLPTSLVDALARNAAALQRTPTATSAPSAATSPGDRASFSGALNQALQTVSAAQDEATALGDAFIADPSKVSLEQAMVSMQKSQVGFQSALHVRNRLVSAYSDIMNMQV